MDTSTVAITGAIRTEVNGSTGWLIIDNEPKRNAVSLAMWQDLPARVQDLVNDDRVRVIVVRGAGESSFVSGADISEFEATRATAAAAKAYDAINVAAFKALKHAAKPTIAMIRGHCIGGGLGIALACDMRIAAEGNQFGIPAARLGIAYPLDAMSDIVEAVGASAAKRLLFTAERLVTQEALSIGLIGERVPADDLMDCITKHCLTLGSNAPLTLAAAKLAINAIASGANDDDMDRASQAATTCYDSADFVEGRNAFLDKRRPTFAGK
ncbi:enoyl-CoA hydratase [Roseibium algae]|uniref:Enoyl-CoA hydratase n=1 Tax=Roseibium algae TaxID=3123038 RepID=A0ABU8TN19_9HYPH